jgi:hypothetical protein
MTTRRALLMGWTPVGAKAAVQNKIKLPPLMRNMKNDLAAERVCVRSVAFGSEFRVKQSESAQYCTCALTAGYGSLVFGFWFLVFGSLNLRNFALRASHLVPSFEFSVPS